MEQLMTKPMNFILNEEVTLYEELIKRINEDQADLSEESTLRSDICKFIRYRLVNIVNIHVLDADCDIYEYINRTRKNALGINRTTPYTLEGKAISKTIPLLDLLDILKDVEPIIGKRSKVLINITKTSFQIKYPKVSNNERPLKKHETTKAIREAEVNNF